MYLLPSIEDIAKVWSWGTGVLLLDFSSFVCVLVWFRVISFRLLHCYMTNHLRAHIVDFKLVKLYRSVSHVEDVAIISFKSFSGHL